jgi:hypothetical protein
MTEVELTDQQVVDLESQLLTAMPSQGVIGNGSLREKLGWDEDLYWYIRNRLLQAGHLVKGKGRGGSVQRVVPVASPVSAASGGAEHYDTLDLSPIDFSQREDSHADRRVRSIPCRRARGLHIIMQAVAEKS